MANITPEINAFRSAVYGEDVRTAMVSLANKVNNEASKVGTFNSRLQALEGGGGGSGGSGGSGGGGGGGGPYVLPNLFVFDTVEDMKADEGLLFDGSYCYTGGFYQVNDGGSAWYRITSQGTANEMDVISCGSLYANLLFNEVLTPEMLGAVGDGVSDDTSAIARAIELGNVVCTKSSYKVSAPSGINPSVVFSVPSDRTIDLNYATITLAYSGLSSYFIFMIDDVDNVSIKNGTIIGDLTENDSRSGEWGRGIGICGDNVLIENVRVLSCQGDGIYIGLESNVTPPENVVVRKCVCNGNGRNGLSFITGTNCVIEDSEFSYNSHKAPKFGIDIEPNNDTPVKVIVNNCVFKGNGLSPLGVYNRFSTDCDVIINNIYTEQTSPLGFTIFEGLGSHIICDNIVCNCNEGYALSLDCYDDSSIDINNITVNFYYNDASLIYTQNLRNATIGNLKINGTSLQVFISNSSTAYLNIGTLDANIAISPRSISNCNLVIDNSTKTVSVTDSSATVREQYMSTVVFEPALTDMATCYIDSSEMPDGFVIRMINNSAVRNRLVTEASNVIQPDDSLANTCYVEPSGVRIIQYSKPIRKFLVIR